MRTHRGFSLIEVVIVVAIVAILASIAIPSYLESVRKAARADARSAIMTVMQQQERYFSQNNSYLAFSTGAGPFKNYSGDAGIVRAKWVIRGDPCGTGIANCIALTAVPNAGHTDSVTSITYDSRGGASCLPATTPQNKCWPR
jgi:type IV pilus assembly protein PilE